MEVDQTSASKPGTSQAAVNLDLPPPRQPRTTSNVEQMEVDYNPALPPHLRADHHLALDQPSSPTYEPSKKTSVRPKTHSHSHSRHEVEPRSASDQFNDESDEPRIASSKSKKHADKSKHKVRSRYVSSSSGEDQSSVARHRSSKPSGAQPSGAVSDQDQPQHDPDPPYYREVALSDIPSQYAEEVDTFRCILSLPDPRESMPRSSTSVMGLDDEKGRQELRPRGPSSMLPLDFQAANLPEGKYIKPPPATTKWYKVGQPCYQEKFQELNTDFAKICLTPKPPGAPTWARFPYQYLRNWNTKLGKISPRSTLLLPLPRLHLLAMLLLKSVNIALSQPSRRLRLRSRKVPILRKQQSVDMNKPFATTFRGNETPRTQELVLLGALLVPVSTCEGM